MVWKIEKNKATLQAKSFSALFDLEQPFLGLSLTDSSGKTEISQLFAFLVPDAPVETYVRGDDLVAKYPPRNSDLVSYQTYFRVTDDGDGIECILSAQTSLLDSKPLTKVTSTFGDGELLFKTFDGKCKTANAELQFEQHDAPAFFLHRPTGESHSWLLFVHPADFYRGSMRTEPTAAVGFHVFQDPLEKGVIRRASFQLRRVARENDEQIGSELLAAAEHAAPPLTT